MTTVREALFDVLRQLGMTTVFGNPGSTEETLLEEFPSDFRYVLGLQEASVVAMADGYAQATGGPALVQLHTSGGVGNAMGNIASAWHNRTPLIILAGNQTREMLLIEPYLTNTRAVELPRPYVKWSYETVRAADAPAALIRAYAAATQPPAGPVFLSIPMDDFTAEIDAIPSFRPVSRRLHASPAGLRDTAGALSDARSPVMLVGGAADIRGAGLVGPDDPDGPDGPGGDAAFGEETGWGDVVRLAEVLRCPVWAAPEEGRPGFPEDHPQFMGPAPAAIGPLAEALEGHDLVLVVGAPVFRYYPFVAGEYLPPGTSLIQLTDDPAEAARAAVGASVLTDPAAACAVLADLVEPSSRALPEPRSAPEPIAPGEEITAASLFAAIEEARPARSVIVQESLSNLPVLRERIPTTRPGSFFSMSSGILGYGLPAAVGVALAHRDAATDRKVVCILGDGAAQYSVQALWTAAQLELPILFVVVRNRQYGTLKSYADLIQAPDVPALDLPGIDAVKLAEGYGSTAARVESPDELPGALRDGLARSGGPHLLEVVVAAEEPDLV